MDRRVVYASYMQTIGYIGKDVHINTVYQTHQLLQCLLLSFACVICNRCRKTERKKYFVARAESFTRQWTFHTSMTASDGGGCFALLARTYWWPFHTRKDRVSVYVRGNLVRRSYCLRKDGVSVSVRNNLVQRSYCLRKGGVSVSVRNKLVTSL